MGNFQARALALLAGHGFVLAKTIEFYLSGRLNLTRDWRVTLIALPIMGMMMAHGALQAAGREDRKRTFWFYEIVSEVLAIGIGLAIFNWAFSLTPPPS